ncbi:primary-amine oxidase [Cylindrospermopsis raciborskii]|uniref:primary-amine oxidase n=1 Tax=Cylindrospermopsis raciborskii TaxID=77022 RepID=UPI0038D1545F
MLKHSQTLRRWGTTFIIIFSIAIIAICIFLWQKVATEESTISHPLSPLTAKEINTAVAVVKREKNLSVNALFPDVSLQEPDKTMVLNFSPNSPIIRQVHITILEPKNKKSYDAVIDINQGKLISWREITSGQPPFLDVEYELLDKLAKADSRWQEAVRKRGISDFENVIVDGWAPGMMNEKERESGKRLIRGITYYKGKDKSNYYGAPLEGLMIAVDLNEGKVFEVIDNGAVPFSKANFDYDEKTLSPLQTALKPLKITQPQGTTFSVEDNQVRWQNWKFRYVMHQREGLTLYQVTYNDRPILYRAALSEMLVPYSNTTRAWAVRSAFDVGEYRFGWLSTPLDRGKDVPENAVLLGAVFADDFGQPGKTENIIGIYERDSGILWRHYDFNTETFEGRRARELVVTTVAAIGNYDYAVNWIFHQDGTIEQKTDMTGIILAEAKGGYNTSEPNFGTVVAPKVKAINHQHMLNFRLDFDVDGLDNWVKEMKVSTLDELANTYGNAFVMMETPLSEEKRAVRDVKASESRTWGIFNQQHRNAVGDPTAYMLMPGGNTPYYPNKSADSRSRGEFATHHFWVTRYKPGELYAAGNYPNQGPLGDGLPRYIDDNESLDNQDLVVWYTYGVTHIPRPEEWPVMTVHPAGFKIMSWGFFDRNPVLNVPKNG